MLHAGAMRVGSRVGFAGLRVCGFAGCELRIAFKGGAFLISILTDINYYQLMLIITIIISYSYYYY